MPGARLNRFSAYESFRELCSPNLYAAHFVPMYGLGDRLTFYRRLNRFMELSQIEVIVFITEGAHDPLIDFFPKRNWKVVPLDFTFPGKVELVHWQYGDSYVRRGSIYFTWHRNFGDGSLAHFYERSGSLGLTHKHLIDAILNIDTDRYPFDLDCADYSLVSEVASSCPPDFSHKFGSKFVLICAEVNSLPPVSPKFFENCGREFQRLGYAVVLNRSRKAVYDPKQASLCEENGFHVFTGDLPEFVSLATRASAILSMRSGICELLGFLGIRVTVINHFNMPFWNLSGWVQNGIQEFNLNRDLKNLTYANFSEACLNHSISNVSDLSG